MEPLNGVIKLKPHQLGHKWKPPTQGAISHRVVSRWIGTVYLCGAFLSHSLNTLNLWAAADMHKSHYKWIMHLQCRQRRSRPRKQPLHPINICPPCLPVSRACWERERKKKIERTTCGSQLSALRKPLQDQMWVAATLAITSAMSHASPLHAYHTSRKYLCQTSNYLVAWKHALFHSTQCYSEQTRKILFGPVWRNRSDHHRL